jgi:uncharacterized membrane protein
MTLREPTTIAERIFASLPYLLPLIDGLAFGFFLFKQFPFLQLPFVPLTPLFLIYGALGPFGGIILFFGLFFLVVRNDKVSYFVRFNTMQAILIDIILIVCRLVLGILAPGLQIAFITETLYNTVFLGLLAAFSYGVIQSLRGQYAEIPTISEAVHMSIPSQF